MKVLVTGANGQLGKSIRKITKNPNDLDYVFKDSKELDITDALQVNSLFLRENFSYCINCAAYTDVENAEHTPEAAFKVNAEGVAIIADACNNHKVILVHISTDYVFDGEKKGPYTTKDPTNPINVYGKSKLEGEKHIRETLGLFFIVRTSWLYSEFGKNFYTTIVNKARRGETLKITESQTGCPTHAMNLARYILTLITSESTAYGIHHFTDGKAMTWYEFAFQILEEHALLDTVTLEKAKNYRTFARRPKNSVLE